MDAVNNDCVTGDAMASTDLWGSPLNTVMSRSGRAAFFHYPDRFDLTSLTYIKVILKQPFTSGVVFATMGFLSRLIYGHNRDEA
jgi:hypothetical protein